MCVCVCVCVGESNWNEESDNPNTICYKTGTVSQLFTKVENRTILRYIHTIRPCFMTCHVEMVEGRKTLTV